MALSTQDRSPNGPKISDSRWSDLQRTLVKELGQSIFEMWFSDPGNIVISGNLVTIYGDSDFSVQRLSTKLSDSISKAVHYCCGPNIQIRYEKRNVSQNIKLNSPGDAGKTRILSGVPSYQRSPLLGPLSALRPLPATASGVPLLSLYSGHGRLQL